MKRVKRILRSIKHIGRKMIEFLLYPIILMAYAIAPYLTKIKNQRLTYA